LKLHLSKEGSFAEAYKIGYKIETNQKLQRLAHRFNGWSLLAEGKGHWKLTKSRRKTTNQAYYQPASEGKAKGERKGKHAAWGSTGILRFYPSASPIRRDQLTHKLL